jgi:diguanylate cyclase (GGDEF)-like protein
MDRRVTPQRGRRSLRQTTLMPGVPAIDAEDYDTQYDQYLRIRRLLVASLFSVLYLLVLAIFFTQGKVDFATLAGAAVAAAVLIAGFYALFRSNLNLRFNDPGLTDWQLFAAVLVMLVVVYRAPETRLVFIAYFFIALTFGMLRVSPKRLTVLGGLALLGYVFTIGLRYLDNENVEMLRTDALLAAVIALTYPWFVYIGGQVKRVERGLAEVATVLDVAEDAAARDELTGLPNRRALNRALEEAKRRTDGSLDPFSVAIVDIDHFKRFNDELGHQYGDEVLQALARTGQAGQRAGDVFGRYGGEEFVQILRGTDLAGALAEAERLRARVGALELPGARWLGNMTISIGVAQYRPRESIATLMARADTALQRAKRSGRNRVVC